jgi:hypothetical protein
MGSRDEKMERIEALWILMDRLCSPDLTLAEAKGLRGRLTDLLEGDHRTSVVKPTGDRPLPGGPGIPVGWRCFPRAGCAVHPMKWSRSATAPASRWSGLPGDTDPD